MGVCHEGYTSLHTFIDTSVTDCEECSVLHAYDDANKFWTLSWLLKPGQERKIDEFEVGRVKNVLGSIRLTREMLLLILRD
jgi:hypothetical protein